MRIYRKLAAVLTVLCMTAAVSGKNTVRAEEIAAVTAAEAAAEPETGTGSAEESVSGSGTVEESEPGTGSAEESASGSGTVEESVPGSGTEGESEPGTGSAEESEPGSGTEGESEPGTGSAGESASGSGTEGESEPGTGSAEESASGSGTVEESEPETESGPAKEPVTAAGPKEDTEAIMDGETAAGWENMPDDRIQQAGRAEYAQEPAFQAKIEWSSQGWIVKGTFKEISPDITLVRPLCSTDGVTYFECGQEWNLKWPDPAEEEAIIKLQNQRCLFGSEEPLQSYLAKNLDRFYIKLRIARADGIVCETQAAVIERGESQPVPKEFRMSAWFAPGAAVCEGRPPNLRYYGRYQITVSEDATAEEIAALLPDTLPVMACVYEGNELIGEDQTDCPVKWKPLELPQLMAGGSVTVMDAAEEMTVPAGTVLTTQRGIYQTTEPVGMNRYAEYGAAGEVRLVLNVVAGNSQPEAVLSKENHGLEIAFSFKTSGAVSIRAYTFQEGWTQWQEIPGLSLVDAVNAQPSTGNSGYALILGKDQEPYRSYRIAEEAGEEPEPFLVGIIIEGGIYDGKQIILAWPDTYDKPMRLPQIEGSGGNVGNAGADNKSDSTGEGQRPELSEEAESGRQSAGVPPVPDGEPEVNQHLEGAPPEGAPALPSGVPGEEAADSPVPGPSRGQSGKTEPDPGSETQNSRPETIAVLPAEEILQAAAQPENNKPVEIKENRPGNARPEIQKFNDRTVKNTGSRVFFAVIAGAGIVSAGVVISHGASAGRIMCALRRIFR